MEVSTFKSISADWAGGGAVSWIQPHPKKISQCEFLTSTERDAILPFESGYDK
jgi:hypothetical protein